MKRELNSSMSIARTRINARSSFLSRNLNSKERSQRDNLEVPKQEFRRHRSNRKRFQRTGNMSYEGQFRLEIITLCLRYITQTFLWFGDS